MVNYRIYFDFNEERKHVDFSVSQLPDKIALNESAETAIRRNGFNLQECYIYFPPERI